MYVTNTPKGIPEALESRIGKANIIESKSDGEKIEKVNQVAE